MAISETLVHTSSTEGKEFTSSHEDFFISSCYPDWASCNYSAKVSEPLSAKQTVPTGTQIRTQWKQESPPGLSDSPPPNPLVCLNT